MAINMGKPAITHEMLRFLSDPRGVWQALDKIKGGIEVIRDNQSCAPRRGPDDIDEPLDEAIDNIENAMQCVANAVEMRRLGHTA